MTPYLYERRFSSAEACQAAGIDAPTFKNWISRDPPAILLSQADRDARDGRGTFSFSFNRIMQIALTAELVGLGFAPRKAGMLAVAFTDVGDGSSNWVGEAEATVVRLPGQLYETGFTVLIIGKGADHAELRNIKPNETWDPFWSLNQGWPSTTLVNVNRIYWAVLSRLGVDKNGDPLQP